MKYALSFAIKNRRRIVLSYSELVRVVEPYMIGMHSCGQQVLLCYQTSGESYAHEPGWREFYLYQVHGLCILGERFQNLRAGYSFLKNDLTEIYCEIASSK